jgi:Fur family ferric uptake transcriptional regulator
VAHEQRVQWSELARADLARHGSRVTGPRLQLLDYLLRYAAPFTAEELLADLQHANIQVGRATVYRTLDLLQSRGWLRLVHRAGGEHGYVMGEPGHQHHLVCRSCGVVIMFEGCELEALLGGLAERLHFRIEDHWLEASGVCHPCQLKAG